MHGITAAFFSAICGYLLLKAIRKWSPFWFFWSGLAIGIGMWFDYRWQIDAGFSLDNMRFTGEVDTLEYSYIQPTASIVYDTRDLYRDQSKGLKISEDL